MFKKIIITLFLVGTVSNAMAYDIHISKTKEWFESEKLPISSNELLIIINSDPELVNDTNDIKSTNPKTGEIIQINTRLSFKYINKTINQEYWFHLIGDRIRFKHTDEIHIKKAKEIAGKLKAFVQGDEGEYY